MSVLSDLVSSLAITESQIKSICRFIFKKDGVTTLTTGETLVVLVCDFLRETGMSFEDYINIGSRFSDEIIAHGKVLENALAQSKLGNAVILPWCFLTVLDNRYVGLQLSDIEHNLDLYDLKDEKRVLRPLVPPAFIFTVAVDALYMRTLASKDGYVKAAEYFNKGLLVGKSIVEN